MAATTLELRLATASDPEVFDEERGEYLLGVASRRVNSYLGSEDFTADATVEDIVVQVAARVYMNPAYVTSAGLGDEQTAFGDYATQGIRLTGMERAELDRIKARSGPDRGPQFFTITRVDYTMDVPW